MPDVKWIKITTDMFEHEKLDFILSLPESDAIIIVWIRLLTLAGKVNAAGYVLLTENIPYTEEMLAHKFRKPPSVIKLALETLKRLRMVEFDGEILRIANWDKHQNVEGMERIREKDRVRQQRHRGKKKLLELEENDLSRDSHVTSHVTVTDNITLRHETEVELDLDLEKNKHSTIDDFQKVSKEYAEIHQVLDLPYSNGPLLSKMLDEGIPADHIIGVIKERYKIGVKTLKYYEDAIRDSWNRAKSFGGPRLVKNSARSMTEAEKKEAYFQRWVNAGNDPTQFVYKPTS